MHLFVNGYEIILLNYIQVNLHILFAVFWPVFSINIKVL